VSEWIAAPNPISEEMGFYEHGKMPRLFTAEQISKVTNIEESRLIQLANEGCAPHVRIDGKQIRFLKEHIVYWVKKNLLHICDGTTLTPVKVLVPGRANIANTPESLSQFADRLYYTPAWVFCGVYFLVRDGRVVYVGQGVNCGSRSLSHSDKKFDHVFVMPCPRQDLNKVEAAFISVLKPEYNAIRKTSKTGNHVHSCPGAYNNPWEVLSELVGKEAA
jgi:hypothetical protein